MNVDFNGCAVSANVPGDHEHRFVMPRDRSTVPPKTLAALTVVEEAVTAAGKATNHEARLKAGDVVRAAVSDLYDRASSTTRADREFHSEAYAYGAAKLARAWGEVQAALQLMADHAGQYSNPVGIGFPADLRDRSKPVMRMHSIAETVRSLPIMPELDA